MYPRVHKGKTDSPQVRLVGIGFDENTLLLGRKSEARVKEGAIQHIIHLYILSIVDFYYDVV